ncbi:hypothetical protein Q1695_008895 [Nippostrongylus brasiliensis]|nr:hypothetical protein Q1695_008895 [Nippostrongylus brasiliensis]
MLLELFVLLILPPLGRSVTITLTRTDGTPKHFYQARSLVVCHNKCQTECETTGSSLWNNLKCSHCTEQCIRRQNLVYEDGPQDRGLIHSVRVCCSRLTTMTQVSTRIFFDLEDDAEVDEAVGLLEYRTLSDDDDLHEPIWTFSQIIQGRSFTLSGLECHKLYQFRLTLVTRKIIDRRTSSWISNRHLCRY